MATTSAHPGFTTATPVDSRLLPASGSASADDDAETAVIVAEPRRSQLSFGESSQKSASVQEKSVSWDERDAQKKESSGVHGFFSPELASVRKEYLTIMIRITVTVILLMWASLPAFWGALYDAPRLTNKLKAWYVDRDDSRIGHALWEGISNYTGGPVLGWEAVNPAVAGSNQDIADSIVAGNTWVVVVIEAHATANLVFARENGDMTYNPQSAITVYYAQARHEVASANFITPIMEHTLKAVISAWATGAAQRYFAQISPGNSTNATAVQMLSIAPQTISPAIDYKLVNLRPYTAPAALAVTLVGNIFLIIFGFLTVMANNHARPLIAPHLSLLQYCIMRIVVPLIAYIPLSLSFTLVSLAFKLPFGGKYSHGAGFMVGWVFAYLGLASLSLSLEAMITIMGVPFIPVFLFLLIVFNVSPVLLPSELQNQVFQYGRGFPIPNLSEANRMIFFNTEPNPGRNAGVLFAWIFMSMITLTLFTYLTHRRPKTAPAH